MTMLSYERSFSIFNKSPKIIMQAYQKLFLKVSFFHSRPMQDYQWKIGFLIFILGLYAKSLRKSQKLIKIEKKITFLKIKNGYFNFTIVFFFKKIDCSILQEFVFFMTIKNSKISEKSCFSNKKVVYHANGFTTFWTTTINYMYEQPKPFLMISKK